MDCRAQDQTDDLHITRATAARWQMVYQVLLEGIFIWRWEAQSKGAQGSGVRANTQSPTFIITASLVEQNLSLTYYNVCMHGMCLWAGRRLMLCVCIRHLTLLLDVCHFLQTLFPGKPATESSGTKSSRYTTISPKHNIDFVWIFAFFFFFFECISMTWQIFKFSFL